jgi:hypothetical protein
MIQGEVGNVIRAAAAVMGLSEVGMIVECGAPTPVILRFEDSCVGVKRGE